MEFRAALKLCAARACARERRWLRVRKWPRTSANERLRLVLQSHALSEYREGFEATVAELDRQSDPVAAQACADFAAAD
jgi:hypothetical protein